MRSKLVILLLIMSAALVAFKPGTSVYASSVSFTLYGNSTNGWGFTSQNLAIPGPDLRVRVGETVQLNLTAVVEPDNSFFPHDFYVDYNRNNQPDSGEPHSQLFGGGGSIPNSTVLTIPSISTPSNYTYYCSLHPNAMHGRFIVEPDAPPRASFNYTPSSPIVGQPVSFNASKSYDPDGIIVSYAWLFGDGGSGSTATIQHTYLNPGNYTAMLTVTDDGGSTNTTSKVLTVTGPGNLAPIADFSFTPSNPILGQQVNFNASASLDPDPGDTVVSYYWVFGDGTTSNLTQPLTSHTYRTFGTIQVSLTVMDSHGARNQLTKQVDVLPIRNVAVIGLTVAPPTVKPGSQVTVHVTVSNEGNVSEMFQIHVGWNSTVTKIWTVTVPPGQTLDESYNWTAPSPGVYTMFARVLSQVDQNAADNEKTTTVTVVAEGPPWVLYGLLTVAGVATVGLAFYFLRKKPIPSP